MAFLQLYDGDKLLLPNTFLDMDFPLDLCVGSAMPCSLYIVASIGARPHLKLGSISCDGSKGCIGLDISGVDISCGWYYFDDTATAPIFVSGSATITISDSSIMRCPSKGERGGIRAANGGSLKVARSRIQHSAVTSDGVFAYSQSTVVLEEVDIVCNEHALDEHAFVSASGNGHLSVLHSNISGCVEKAVGWGVRSSQGASLKVSDSMIVRPYITCDDENNLNINTQLNLENVNITCNLHNASTHDLVEASGRGMILTLMGSTVRGCAFAKDGWGLHARNQGALIISRCRIENSSIGLTGQGHVSMKATNFSCNVTIMTDLALIRATQDAVLFIEDSRISDCVAFGHGGSMLITTGASLSLKKSLIQNCHSSSNGGAFAVLGANALVYETTIRNCTSQGSGGAVAIFSSQQPYPLSPLVSKVSFTKSAFGDCSSQGEGGALSVSDNSDVSVVTTNFLRCESRTNGGAAAITSLSTVLFTEALMDACKATDGGGALYLSAAAVTVESSKFVECQSARGGALALSSMSSASFSNSLFRRCVSKTSGGAMYVGEKSLISAVSCSFADNSAGGFGGGAIHIKEASFSVTHRKGEAAIPIQSNSAPAGGGGFLMWEGSVEPVVDVQCAPGFSGDGNSCQALCNAGRYVQSTAGTSSCAVCTPGKASSAGSTTCYSCNPGTIAHGNGSQNCTACDAGKMSDATNIQCVECKAGQYSVSGFSACLSCSPGTVSRAVNSSTCSICAAGKYSKMASTACSDCLAGKYAKYEGSSACQECSKGEFSVISGANKCVSCSTGTFSNATASALCWICEPGTYSGMQASTACVQCAAGRASNVTGASTCSACEAGKFSRPGGAMCTLCQAGKISSSESAFCKPCESGKVCTAKGGISCSTCQPVSVHIAGYCLSQAWCFTMNLVR